MNDRDSSNADAGKDARKKENARQKTASAGKIIMILDFGGRFLGFWGLLVLARFSFHAFILAQARCKGKWRGFWQDWRFLVFWQEKAPYLLAEMRGFVFELNGNGVGAADDYPFRCFLRYSMHASRFSAAVFFGSHQGGRFLSTVGFCGCCAFCVCCVFCGCCVCCAFCGC